MGESLLPLILPLHMSFGSRMASTDAGLPSASQAPALSPASSSSSPRICLDPAVGRKEELSAAGGGGLHLHPRIPPSCIGSWSWSRVPGRDKDLGACWKPENPPNSQNGSNSASFGENSEETFTPCNAESKSQNEENCYYSYIAKKKKKKADRPFQEGCWATPNTIGIKSEVKYSLIYAASSPLWGCCRKAVVPGGETGTW